LHKINKSLAEGNKSMEETMFRTGFEKLFFQMQRALKDYLNEGNLNQEILNNFIITQTKVISPFCPHVAEEIWQEIGNKTFISLEKWPEVDSSKIDEKLEEIEKNIDKTVSDILNVLNIIKQKTGKEGTKIYLYVMPNELSNYNPEIISKRVCKEIKIFAVNDKTKFDPENKSSKAKPGKPAIFIQ
jgi:leucyl-tRNA synthetase